jgi:ABC-type Zn uptake system ZnuABC Zn-binding protein ZnuA
MSPYALELARMLSSRGLKLTPQRKAVLDVVAAAEVSVSPAQVYDAARSVYPDLGLTTVYRTSTFSPASERCAACAKQLTELVRAIERTGVKAILVELGENSALARQVAAEAHVRVVTDLLDHSLTAPTGVAPTYLAMMRYDTERIVGALK